MALAFDAATGGTANSTSLTYSHTCTGSNLVLIVGVNFFGSLTDDITGVTYNGVAMTQITKVTDNTAGQAQISYLYYLIAPATGAHNVVVSKTASGSIRSNSASYTGADQIIQPDASNQNNVTANSITTSVTTVADNCWVVSFAMNSGAGIAAGTGVTARDTSQTFCGIGDNNAAKHPAGSVSEQWTGSTSFTMVMASISPFGTNTVSSGPSIKMTTNTKFFGS